MTSRPSTSSLASLGRGPGYERALIVVVALVLRLVLGFCFFGSGDLTDWIIDTEVMFMGNECPPMAYYPIVPAVIWMQGVASLHSPLPLAFCQKLVPIVFDSLMAILIYDILARRRPRFAFPAGMLHALNPLALIVTCLHVQWDPVCMFFLALALNLVDDDRPGLASRVIAGACFTLSFLVKPYTFICFPLIFPPLLAATRQEGWFKASLELAIAAAAALGIAFLTFYMFGFDVIDRSFTILEFARGGVQNFGLPFALEYLGWTKKGRTWTFLVMALVALAYHRKKVGRFEAALFCFSFPLGVSGISPQYLYWPVPFLLITRAFRLGALYHLVAVPFLIVYYMTPMDTWTNFKNRGMGTFASLRTVSWLMPPKALGEGWTAALLPVFGDVVIPLAALAVAFGALGLSLNRRPTVMSDGEEEYSGHTTPAYWLYATIVAVLAGCLVVTYAVADRDFLKTQSVQIIKAKLTQYDMDTTFDSIEGLGPMRPIGHFPRVSFFNAAVLLMIGTVVWSVASYRLGQVDRRRAPVHDN